MSDTVEEGSVVVFLGDSNTWCGGDNCDIARGWNYWYCRLTSPASQRSYARSGATWVHTDKMMRDTEENTARLSDNNVITNQIYRLQEAVIRGEQSVPTHIFIMAGTNDMWFRSSLLPTLPDVIRCDIELLRQSFPSARITLITPMQTTKVKMQVITETAEAIAHVADELGLDVVRADSPDIISRDTEIRKLTFTRDGVHTNELGAKRLAEFVIRH